MNWIIEVHVEISKNKWEWKAMHPTSGKRYEYPTEREALKMRGICYPDTSIEVVRVRQLKEGE
jgi:hypothetical protein